MVMHRGRIIAVVLLIFGGILGASFLTSPVETAPVLVLDKHTDFYALGQCADYLEDPSGQLDIAAVRNPLKKPAWQKSDVDVPNFGFSQSTYWFRVRLKSPEMAHWLLAVDYPMLDDITLYLFAKGKLLQTMEEGDTRPFAERPLLHRAFVFPLNLPLSEQVSLYLRVKSEGPVQVPMRLWQEAAYHQHDEREVIVYSLYFGVVLVMIFYNFFIYLRVHESTYLYYIFYVALFGLFQVGLSGMGFMYLWPKSVDFERDQTVIFVGLACIFACRFIYSFLDLPHNSPRIGRLLNVIILALVVLLLLLPFTSYHMELQSTLALAFVATIFSLYAGIMLWRGGEVAARIFTIAWGTFLFAIMLAILGKFGVIPRSFWTEGFMPLAMVSQVILLSLALAERINSERQQRLDAQQQALLLVRESKEELERKVQERTVELEKANEQLEFLAATDGLTGIFNLRHFFEEAQQAIDVAERYRHPIALIMLDLDHFKRINDQYGHAVGDLALKHFVDTCRGINRDTDIFGRIGGEEFAILLLETDSDSALAVAERLRRSVESSPLDVEGERIGMTVSQGICAIASQPYLTAEEMLKVADKALYQAKAEGRNRVVLAPVDI